MSDLSKSLLQGAKEALAYAQGVKNKSTPHRVLVPEIVDVRAIRKHLHMTRKVFSENFGLSLRTIEKWEQGCRQPDDAAKLYLTVIAKNPEAVISSLRAAH